MMNAVDKENQGPNRIQNSNASSIDSTSYRPLGTMQASSSAPSLVNDRGRRAARAKSPESQSSSQNLSAVEAEQQASLQNVLRLVEGLTKLDIAEIRTMTKPPAAVEIVLEAVMILLTGKIMSFQDVRKLMGSGESFLLMLREFRISDISDNRLQMIEP